MAPLPKHEPRRGYCLGVPPAATARRSWRVLSVLCDWDRVGVLRIRRSPPSITVVVTVIMQPGSDTECGSARWRDQSTVGVPSGDRCGHPRRAGGQCAAVTDDNDDRPGRSVPRMMSESVTPSGERTTVRSGAFRCSPRCEVIARGCRCVAVRGFAGELADLTDERGQRRTHGDTEHSLATA